MRGPTGPGVVGSDRRRAVPNTAAGRKAARAAKAAKAAAKRAAKPSLLYVLDAPATLSLNQVVITLARRHKRPGSDRGALKPWYHQPTPAGAARLAPEDREILELLDLARDVSTNADSQAVAEASSPANGTPAGMNRFILRPDVQAEVVERLCRTGRCRLRRTEDEDDPPGLRWDDGPPWEFWIDIRCADAAAKRWTWRGTLRRRRGEDRMDLAEPLVLLPGLVIQGIGRAARFDDAGIYLWMARLRHEKEMSLPRPSRTPCSAGSWAMPGSAPTGWSRTCTSKRSTCRPSPA